MRVQETDPRLPDWLNAVLNAKPFCIDTDNISTAAAAVDAQGVYMPGKQSLFYNGYVMVRVCWPLGVWLHIKPVADHRFQCGFGYKLNGRLGLTLRWQSDASAAKGVLGPNLGQAGTWDRGTA